MLPIPALLTPPEPFAPHWAETECTPGVQRPGVLAWRDFVLEHQGGTDMGIGRRCGSAPSAHYSNRAWDWGMDASDPAQRARVEELLTWLLDLDAEMFRRVGLRYVIWDRERWSSSSPGWQPYDGYDAAGNCTRPRGCRNPHTDHVHFSFGKPGAAGETSFFQWLGSGRPAIPAPPRPATPPARPTTSSLSAALVVMGSFGLGFAAMMAASRRLR